MNYIMGLITPCVWLPVVKIKQKPFYVKGFVLFFLFSLQKLKTKFQNNREETFRIG